MRKLQITPETVLSAGLSTGAAMGIRLGNEAEGVKSWFLFEDEIICAGAGVKAHDSENKRLVTVVDTIPVTGKTKLALTNPSNGFRNVRNASGKAECGRRWSITATQGFIPRETGSAPPQETEGLRTWTGPTYSATEKADLILRKEIGLLQAEYERNRYGSACRAVSGAAGDVPVRDGGRKRLRMIIPIPACTRQMPDSCQIRLQSRQPADVGEGGTGCHQVGTGTLRLDNQVVPVTMDSPGGSGIEKRSLYRKYRATVAKIPSQTVGSVKLVLEAQANRFCRFQTRSTAGSSHGGERSPYV